MEISRKKIEIKRGKVCNVREKQASIRSISKIRRNANRKVSVKHYGIIILTNSVVLTLETLDAQYTLLSWYRQIPSRAF